MPGAAHNRTPLYVRWADRYQIVRRIGAGGFAEVFEAYDRRLERPVALKVVPEERGMSGRVVREVEAALSLSHPGIVALYDFFSDGERSYLVWELIEGESLAVAGPRLHDAEAAEVMAEVLEALAYAHSQGVVHRDIKPQNIMIDRAGRAKIMDFGIARLIDAETLTSEGDVLGTVAYMSPEQADGRRAGPASDVYSSAIVLYELLAGHNPVRGATAAETLSNVIAGRITPLEEVRSHVPMDVADAVYAASAPRAAERPPAADFAAVLRRAVADGSLGARRLRARQVLEPLRRGAVLTERIAGAVLTGATSAFVLQHLPAYPASWTLPMFALAAAVWFVFPAAGLAWTLGTLAFCVFNVSWSLGVVYLAGAVALYWTTRGRPLTALWPVLALLLTPVLFTLVAPAAAALFGRVRGPLVAAWAGAGTLFALLLLRVGRSPFTGYQPTGDLAVRLRAAGNPLIAGARVVTILFSPQALFQMGTWAAFALAMYGIVRLARLELRLWGWSLSLATVFALYRVIPINVWHASAPLGAIVLGVSLTAVVVLLPVALGVGSVPEEQDDEHP